MCIISARKATKNEQKEYDFTHAEQGKFFRPIEELDIPIYLDQEVKSFFLEKIKNTKEASLNSLINALLKQDIEISKKLA